jgi:hypothetical protein
VRHARGLELVLLLALSVGCRNGVSEKEQPARAVSSISPLRSVLAVPRADRFSCGPDQCVQSHPRLPDSGQWRCAESEQVVWCAGGEPAAGVALAPPDPGYRCGPRFGGASERICIDEHPDYPPPHTGRNRCAFAQEHGVARVCRAGATNDAKPLSPGALPACWLGKDCRSGDCDRGTCRCATDQDCERGVCHLGVCAEGAR